MKIKGNRVQFAVYLYIKQYEELKKLSEKSRVDMAVYVRDGIEFVLKKNKRKSK